MAKLPILITAALLSIGCSDHQDAADLIHWRTQQDGNIVVQPVRVNRAAHPTFSIAPPTGPFTYVGRVHTDRFGPLQTMDYYTYVMQPNDTSETLMQKLNTSYFSQTLDNRMAIQGNYLGTKRVVGTIAPGQTLSIYIPTGQSSGQSF